MNFNHAILTSGICLMAATMASAAPQNLIVNGDFDQIKNDQAVGWTINKSQDFVTDSFPTEADQGRVAQINFPKYDTHGAYFGQNINVQPHTNYRFSLKARMNTGNIRIAVSGGDGNDKINIVKMGRTSHLSMYPLFWDEAWSKNLVFAPNQWRTVTIDFDSDNVTKVYISFGGYQRKGVYSFDDVSLIEMKEDLK